MEGTWRLFQAKTTRREAEFSDCTVHGARHRPRKRPGRNLRFEGLPPAPPSSQTNCSSSPAGQTVCELLLPVHRASNTGNVSIFRVAWDRHELPIPQPCVARSRSRGPNRRGTAACLLQVSSTLGWILPVTGGGGGVWRGVWRGVAGSEPLNPFGPSGDNVGFVLPGWAGRGRAGEIRSR